MTDMIIRQATCEDAEAIFEIENLCFPDPWSLESIEYELEKNPAAVYVVAEIDAADAVEEGSVKAGDSDVPVAGIDKLIVGYAGLWWIENEGHITNVAIRPGYRNRRIGSQILETLLEYTQEEGIDDFTLEVRESNDAARALYEKYGFTVEGKRKNYYRSVSGDREDALVLWRRMSEREAE